MGILLCIFVILLIAISYIEWLLLKATNTIIDTEVIQEDMNKTVQGDLEQIFKRLDALKEDVDQNAERIEETYNAHMSDVQSSWKKIADLSNDINRTKMRVGGLEQNAQIESPE